MRWAFTLVAAACAVGPQLRPVPEVEGLVRQRERRCGVGFTLAVPLAAVRSTTLELRAEAGGQVVRVATSDEGAFRAALEAGTYCVSEPRGACLTTFTFDPAHEPTPVIVLPAAPCP